MIFVAKPVGVICVALLCTLFGWSWAAAAQSKATAQDYMIDGADPGVRLFVRQKMAPGNTRFTDDNIVIFIHGATGPSTCDFDLNYKDYSWADWMVEKGYVVYMFDKRNYGNSNREKAMDEPASANKPLSRSYLVIRDIGAVVDHVHVLIKDATHFVLFEKPRFEFFNGIQTFLKE